MEPAMPFGFWHHYSGRRLAAASRTGNRYPTFTSSCDHLVSALRYTVIATLSCGAAALAAQSPQAPGSSTGVALVLTHANIVDGVSASPIRDATIVISGRTIQRIERGSVTPPAGAQVMDIGGKYIVPGYIDAHAHIETLDGARRALETGVTTIRSASVSGYQDIALREMARTGVIAGPDVLAAGIYVTPQLGETVLADPRLAPLSGGVETPEQLRLLVRVNLDHGVDVIKTRGTERAGLADTDPRKQAYTEAQLRVIVEEAATKNVPVMAHAHGDEGAWAAVRAGVRSIEHGTYLSDSTLALMKSKGTFLVPTISTMLTFDREANPVLWRRNLYMPQRLFAVVRKAHRLGIRIATGSDSEYDPTKTMSIGEEMLHLTEAGLSNFEALRSGTIVGAELLGLEKKTGSVRPGLEADLVVVERNPLEDIRTLSDPLTVISNGRVAMNRLPFGKAERANP
jgi:imidazolonepropionase-like amidohydrolase